MKKMKFLNYFFLQFLKDQDPCSFPNELSAHSVSSRGMCSFKGQEVN